MIVPTARHYERLGLLPPASRTPGGYRQFPPSAVNRVLLVREAAADVLATIEREIAELSGKRDAMRKTLADWDERLARTPAGALARLLGSLSGDVRC